MKMQGHTILVAGGVRGIGRGLAELLHRLGNEVLVFGGDPGAAEAVARANPGMRAVELALSDPWSVAGFAERVTAVCPGLNMLVNISIAFPVKDLPGLGALLDDDPHEALEAQRLGIQHLTGALMPHLRKRSHSSVMNLAVGPAFAPPPPALADIAARPATDGGVHACTLSVRTRRASTRVEVVDVALPSWAERAGREPASPAMSRVEFVASVANLLAGPLHEEAVVARLRSLCPAPRPVARETRDDGLVPQPG